MKGEHKILIYSKRIKFEFTVRRNITILKGDSATGKTTLVNMIRDYNNNGVDSGITLTCDKKCEVLSGNRWETDLDTIKDSIVFIDEGNKFVASERFAKRAQDSDNYYVIISRENFPMLPYSVNEIYGLKESGKHSNIKQVYNESYWLYEEYGVERS
jgi:predicted ABC-class ATPase